MFDRVYSGVELRRQGRTLTGAAIRYGDRSPTHRERFEAGAFAEDLRDARVRWLDVEHRVREVLAWTSGGGLEIHDTPEALTVTANLPEIPAANQALLDLALKRLNGLSVEFRSLDESRDADGTRVIRRARLQGFGLVRSPSYRQSTVEVRGRSGRSLRSSIPSGKKLGCRCSGKNCQLAQFSKEAVEAALDTAFKPGSGAVAVYKDYSQPLGSVPKGTLRRDGKAGFIIDLPDDPSGAAVVAADESAGIVARPYLDVVRTEGVAQDLADGQRVMLYENPKAIEVRAFVVSATDERQGWPTPELVATPDEVLKRSAEGRRLRRWL